MFMPYLINRVVSGKDLMLITKTLWHFLVKFDIMPYMVTIIHKKVFFVHLVVEHYIAIFAMPVAVSEIRVGQRSICDI